MADVTRRLKIITDLQGNAENKLKLLTGSLGGLGKLAGGAALSGIVALGAGIAGVGVAGLSMNNTMEQARARISAFTKDGAKTSEILEMIRRRAAATPFAFNDMANAAAGLIPAANQAGESLESLIQDAEILAASNPAEGLEGAAFALREAVSGDFTSIIERFNLPRQFINKLKEEGVPALEIVRRAMKEMGYDTELVTNLANTASGRWSTLKDTFQNLASVITQPIFDSFSQGLGGVNDILTKFEPQITRVAEMLAGKLAEAIQNISTWITSVAEDAGPRMLEFLNKWSEQMAGPLSENIRLTNETLSELSQLFGYAAGEVSAADVIVGAFSATLIAVRLWLENVNARLRAFKEVLQAVKSTWGTIGPIISAEVTRWRNAFSAVRSVIDSVKNAFDRLAAAARRAVNAVPDWLRPGSPTPFEVGLRGIARAADSVSGVLPGAFAVNGNAPLAGPPAAAATGGGIVVQLNYSPVLSTADEFELERVLTDVVRRINRKP